MITHSIFGFLNIIKILVILVGIYSIISYVIYRFTKNKKTVCVLYEIFIVSTVIFCLFKWYIATALWCFYTIVKICYYNKHSNNSELVSKIFPYQLGSFGLINIQLVFEKYPVFDTVCFSGELIPDYILNVCCITSILFVMYYLLRPLSLKGRPKYSGWKIDYTVCFIIYGILIHIIFFCVYFFS